MEAGADIEPLHLAFGHENEDENMLGEDVLVQGDDVEHELPVPEEGGCSRAVYQRFSSQYRRWVQRQLNEQTDDASIQRVSARLSLKKKSPKQKALLA